MFFYAGTALLWLLGPLGARAKGVVLVVVAAGLAVPMVHHWSVLVRDAGACREATQAGEPEACLFRRRRSIWPWRGGAGSTSRTGRWW
jgi:hypothetical protein